MYFAFSIPGTTCSVVIFDVVPIPSSPLLLIPDTYTFLSAFILADIFLHISFISKTSVAAKTFPEPVDVLPIPKVPYGLYPQQYAFPVASIIPTLKSPNATLIALCFPKFVVPLLFAVCPKYCPYPPVFPHKYISPFLFKNTEFVYEHIPSSPASISTIFFK